MEEASAEIHASIHDMRDALGYIEVMNFVEDRSRTATPRSHALCNVSNALAREMDRLGAYSTLTRLTRYWSLTECTWRRSGRRVIWNQKTVTLNRTGWRERQIFSWGNGSGIPNKGLWGSV